MCVTRVNERCSSRGSRRPGNSNGSSKIGVANLPTLISVAIRPDHTIVVGASGVGTVAGGQGVENLGGASIMLNLVSPKGDVIPPAGGFHVESLTIPSTCAHSPCAQGAFLNAGCGPDDCVTSICSADPWCCGVSWDGQCVGEVTSICRQKMRLQHPLHAHGHAPERICLLPHRVRLHRHGLCWGSVVWREQLGRPVCQRGCELVSHRLPLDYRDRFSRRPFEGRSPSHSDRSIRSSLGWQRRPRSNRRVPPLRS